MGYNSVADNTGLLYRHRLDDMPPKHEKYRKLPREFDLTGYSSSRSSKVIDLGINRKPIYMRLPRPSSH